MRHTIPGLLLALAACGGGADAPTPPPAPTPAIALAVSPSQLSVVAGTTSAPVTLTLTRTGTVSSDVQLTLEGSPPVGARATLASPTLQGQATTTSLTVSTTSDALPGTGAIVVRATAGTLSATATIQVTITPRPEFSVVVDSTITVPILGSGQATLRLTRAGDYAAPVPLLIGGLPPGATASFSPDTLRGTTTTSTLTITTTANIVPGRYPLQLVARGGGAPGVGDKSLPLALIVPAPQGAVRVRTDVPQVVLLPGGTTTLRAFVRRTAPFAGPVTLVVPGTVSGLTIRVVPQVIPAGDTAATITVDAAPNAPIATPFIPLVATGQGVAPDTTRFAVGVLNVPGDYVVILNGGMRPTITAGTSVSLPVEVFRKPPFTGAVTLTPGTQPTGITLAFSPATITGTTGSATVTVAPTVAPGRYFLEWQQSTPGTAPDVVATSIDVVASAVVRPEVAAKSARGRAGSR
jgi:hypothetical protein